MLDKPFAPGELLGPGTHAALLPQWQQGSDWTVEWIEYVLSNPIRSDTQANGRIRRWALISEAGKCLRVVTEPDGETVHNAFFDRRFKPEPEQET